MTSWGEIRWSVMRSGSSQIRIAYRRPKTIDVADAGDPPQDVDDADLGVIVEEGRNRYEPSGEIRLTTQTMSVDAFLISTPDCLTSLGSVASAVWTLFWTSTAAMSRE